VALTKSYRINPDASSQGSDKQLGGGHRLVRSTLRLVLIGEHLMPPTNGLEEKSLLKTYFQFHGISPETFCFHFSREKGQKAKGKKGDHLSLIAFVD
jgi:hypothetical protein